MSLVAFASCVYIFLFVRYRLMLDDAEADINQVWFRQANARRDAGLEDDKSKGKTEEEIAELGDESPRFRYMT